MTRQRENYTPESGDIPGIPSATQAYFRHQGEAPEFEGSVAAIVANENNPAFVRIQDRILGVLDGSRIHRKAITCVWRCLVSSTVN